MSRKRSFNLRRKEPYRDPKHRFVIYCEGARTEPAYFNALKQTLTDALIEVETVPGVGVPYTVAESAVARAKSLERGAERGQRLNSFEERDQVWAVFDRDQHPRFEEAVQLCQQGQVGVGRSNPCFEVWLILHLEDYGKPDGRHAVQKYLQRLRPEYNWRRGKSPNCAVLVEKVVEAEKRAERMLKDRVGEGVPFGPPSTTVGLLTQVLRKAAIRSLRK